MIVVSQASRMDPSASGHPMSRLSNLAPISMVATGTYCSMGTVSLACSRSECAFNSTVICWPLVHEAQWPGAPPRMEPPTSGEHARPGPITGGGYKLGDMYTTIYVYDFPSRSSKLSSRSLRLGNKELLHTTQSQTALYTASGERREMGIVPTCFRIILSFCVVRGQ